MYKLGLGERGAVGMIIENIYLQYFCSLSSYQIQKPFHPTVFIVIRKLMGADSFEKWNETIIEKADDLQPENKRMIIKGKSKQNSESAQQNSED